MQALCIPPERRVFKLCYLCELMAVVSGLVMFLSAYLLRFDATSTFGVVGAFFANVSLLFNLTGSKLLVYGHEAQRRQGVGT